VLVNLGKEEAEGVEDRYAAQFTKGDGHGRSGSVAFPRTKLVLAMAAAGFMAPARRAPRRVRRSVDDIVVAGVCFTGDWLAIN
jgi:hypothetical protein